MKAIKKGLAAVMIFTLIVLSMTACSATDKLALLDAFEKTAQITTYESQSQMRFDKINLDTNISEFEMIEPFISLMEGLTISINQKSYENAAKTVKEAQVDMHISAGDIAEDTTVWAYTYLTGETPMIKEIVKIPEIAAATLPPELQGKTYMVIDQGDLEETGQISESDYKEIVDTAKDMQANIINIIKEYALKTDMNIVAVTQLDDRIINGEKHAVYQLKLDDTAFKIILKSVASEVPDNAEVKEMIKDFMLLTMGVTSGYEGGEDLERAFETLRNGKTNFKQDINTVLDRMKDVRMLGTQGIAIDFVINPDGYIVKQNGVIDLYMDSQQVENALEKIGGETSNPADEHLKAAFGMTFTFNSDISNINGAVSIDFPELTEENSFGLSDMLNIGAMSRNVKTSNEKKPKAISINEAFEKAEVYPVKAGSLIMLPLGPICQFAGAEYKAEKNGKIQITIGDTKIQGSKNSADIKVNKEAKQLNFPISYFEDHYFIPKEMAEDYLNVEVAVNKDNQMLFFKK